MIIQPIHAFTDNYIWLLHDQSHAVVVDPGDAAPVIDALQANNLSLVAILITHHHQDHIGGVEALKSYAPESTVYGPTKEAQHTVEVPMQSGSLLTLPLQGNPQAHVFDVPGHTKGHIAYLVGDALFCGDTLFCGGCGRLFEGTAAQMHASLNRFAQLPADTKVYCAHEYTLANLDFALTVDPDNPTLNALANRARRLRQAGESTLPSTIATELAINPFLRTQDSQVVQAASRYAGRTLSHTEEVFSALRRWKDEF